MTEFIDAYCQSVNEVSLSVKRVYTCVSLSLSRPPPSQLTPKCLMQNKSLVSLMVEVKLLHEESCVVTPHSPPGKLFVHFQPGVTVEEKERLENCGN